MIGNGHDNHVTLWCDESHNTHAPSDTRNSHRNSSNHHKEGGGRDGQTVVVPMTSVKRPVENTRSSGGGGGGAGEGHRGLNGNTWVVGNSPGKPKLSHRTAL